MKTTEIFKNCEFCDTEFPANRSTAKFCSNTCRTKANNQRRENEKIEAQKAIEQAEKDELKRKASEARKLKKTEKDRLAEQKIQDQEKITAAELAEKQRIADEAQKQKSLNEEADAKKRLADEEQRKKEEKEENDLKDRAAFGIGIIIALLVQTKPKNENNPNNGKLCNLKEPDSTVLPNSVHKPGNSKKRKNLNPTYSGLNSSGFPSSKELSNKGFSNNPKVTPNIKPSSKTPNFFEGALGPLIDDISDFWNRF